MKLGKLAITSMKNEKKKYVFLIVNLTFAVAVSIIFSHFLANPTMGFSSEMAITMMQEQTLPVVYLFMMAACIIAVSIALVFYANESYLASEKRTLSILAMSGASLGSIFQYFAIQHFICMAIALVFGLIISLIAYPLINFILSQSSVFSIPIFSYQASAFAIGFIIIALMLFFLWLCDIGYVYRSDKFELSKPISTTEQFEVIPAKHVFSLIGYIVPLVMILIIPPVLQLYLLYMIIGTAGISGIFHSVLPRIFKKLQKKHALHSIQTILYSNLIYTVKQNGILTKMISASMMMLCVLLCNNASASLTLTYIGISFVILLSMMLLCIYNNTSALAHKRKHLYQNLVLLGYDTSMLASIIKKEQRIYFGLLFLFPMVYVILTTIKFMMYEEVSIFFIIIVLLLCFALIVLCEKLCEIPHKAMIIKQEE